MFYTWKELARWLSVSPFEIFLFLLGLLVTSVLVALKLEPPLAVVGGITWWHVLTPLFIFDAIDAYFVTIVIVREWMVQPSHRSTVLHAIFNYKRLVLSGLVKSLLAYKLEKQLVVNYSEIFLPLFLLLFLLLCHSFRLS